MNSSPIKPEAVPARLDDLIAIHREIAALVRAGIPLELGLRGFGAGMPTRLRRVADRIANRLSDGISLADAIDAESPRGSGVYAAVIGAGVRSGRLADALEALALSCEQIQETRHHAMLAVIHPTIVCIVAYLLFAMFGFRILEIYLQAAEEYKIGNEPVFRYLSWLRANATTLLWSLPLLILVAVAGFRGFVRAPGGWFGSSSMFCWLNRAQFADILMIQVEHGLPLADSLVRAADSTTDPGLHAAAKILSDEVNSGVPFPLAVSSASQIPAMMRWSLASGARQQNLVKTLKLMRDSYRLRAAQRIRVLKVWLPIAMTVGVSGMLVLLYGSFFFWFLSVLWQGIMRE